MRKFAPAAIAATIILTVAFATIPAAQSADSLAVNVSVLEQDGSPIDGATVTLALDGVTVDEGVTDAAGLVGFNVPMDDLDGVEQMSATAYESSFIGLTIGGDGNSGGGAWEDKEEVDLVIVRQ